MKSDTAELRVPLYLESNEVNLSNGTVVFKIAASEQEKIKKINLTNKTFYITITTNGIETVIYDGKISLLANTPRKNNTNSTLANNNTSTSNIKNKIRTSKIRLAPNKFVKGKSILDNLQKNALNPIQLKRLL